MGRLIPAGTGMEFCRRIKIPEEVVERPEGDLGAGYEAELPRGARAYQGGVGGLASTHTVSNRGPPVPRGTDGPSYVRVPMMPLFRQRLRARLLDRHVISQELLQRLLDQLLSRHARARQAFSKETSPFCPAAGNVVV
jgi:hypothetical protein